MKARKEKSRTKALYRRWRVAKGSLYVGTYTLPLVPASVMLTNNWNEWFNNDQWSIGLGFGMLLLTVFITIFGVAKRDKVMSENVSSIYYLAFLLGLWSIVLMFLASIANEFGLMLLYTCFGLVGGGTCDQLRKVKVDSEVEFYRQIIVEAGLDERLKIKEQKKEQARQRAFDEAKRRAVD